MSGRYGRPPALTMAGQLSTVNNALIGLLVGFRLQLAKVAMGLADVPHRRRFAR
jgi:hypothetical protein